VKQSLLLELLRPLRFAQGFGSLASTAMTESAVGLYVYTLQPAAEFLI
jgi:hypothetical protein